jgi:hypothetical protein
VDVADSYAAETTRVPNVVETNKSQKKCAAAMLPPCIEKMPVRGKPLAGHLRTTEK